MIHQALRLFGLPCSVSCTRALQRAGSEVDDFFTIVLRFAGKSRLVVQLEAGYLFHGTEFGERVWLVYGENGSFEKRGGIDPQGIACFFFFLFCLIMIIFFCRGSAQVGQDSWKQWLGIGRQKGLGSAFNCWKGGN